MKIIVCIDNKNGMMFGGKRQSQDVEVRSRIADLSAQSKLWMSNYSAKQFEALSNLCVSDNYFSEAQTGEYCFVESNIITTEKIEEVVVYKWNRTYPADCYFDFDLKANSFKKISSVDFVGNSHKKITEEIYVKK